MAKYPEYLLFSYALLSAKSFVCTPQNYDEILGCIDYAKNNSLKICVAGSRQSFSNVCLIKENISIDIRKLNNILNFDEENQEVTVQSGILTADLLIFLLSKGFILNGLTGSLQNTIAGEIASDVNGKDSWKNGNFGENVVGLKLITASGNILNIQKNEDPDTLNAVIGGLGLTGVIIEVTLKICCVSSLILRTQSIKVQNINELTEAMFSATKTEIDFAYCWTDPFAPRDFLGRGFCEVAAFDNADEKLTAREMLKGFKQKTKIGPFKPEIFWALFRKIDFAIAYQIAGYAKFYLSRNKKRKISFPEYQYPMVKIFPKWNLKYHPHGFREWQILFETENFEAAYKEVIRLCRTHKFTPYICAVRKHKKQTPFLSFAGNGFSMTVNYGMNDHPTERRIKFENELTRLVLDYKGKVYLAKYPFLSKQVVEKMYPQFSFFLDVKNKIDSENLFWSDAAESIFAK